MAEAGTGNEQLARKVNTAGSELGLRLRYDKSTVSHWLRGSVPEKEARPAVAEALSRLLGRPVTPAELGWGARPDTETDVASGVTELSRADMDPSRRSVLGAGLYSATLLVPSFPDLVGRTEAAPTSRRSSAPCPPAAASPPPAPWRSAPATSPRRRRPEGRGREPAATKGSTTGAEARARSPRRATRREPATVGPSARLPDTFP